MGLGQGLGMWILLAMVVGIIVLMAMGKLKIG